jgi:hypothetical protein
MRSFSCSGGTCTDSTKSALGHVRPNLGFCSRWDLRVTQSILVRPGHEMSTYYFSCSGGSGAISIKMPWHTLRRTWVFASGGICTSCSAFWCIRAAKRPRTIFHGWVGPVRLGREILTHYFSCSGGHGAVSINSALGHVTPNLCFYIRWDLRVT